MTAKRTAKKSTAKRTARRPASPVEPAQGHTSTRGAGPRPIWDAGESRQEFHARLAAWKASKS